MYRIIKIGMNVHSTNYTLCAMEPVIGAEDRVFANIQITPDYKNILMFIENLKLKFGLNDTYDIECGYEAGCLGYSLYNQLTASGGQMRDPGTDDDADTARPAHKDRCQGCPHDCTVPVLWRIPSGIYTDRRG